MATAKKNAKLTPKKENIWDTARRLVLHRSSPCGIYSEIIDPGVNYFVLMLEQLGAITHYSCEGHPDGFYVLFKASLTIAEKIHACGYFTVELEGNGLWSIRTRRLKADNERVALLRWAAEAWEEKLGPCTAF
jgi:hypothetical protein